jgi:hypothetical protein
MCTSIAEKSRDKFEVTFKDKFKDKLKYKFSEE